MPDKRHTLPWEIEYYSKRYDEYVIVEKGYKSDGATGAIDLWSRSWWVHDKLCDTGVWASGRPCTNLQASTVLYDILKSENRNIRALYWFLATYIFGGGKCRKNENYWATLKGIYLELMK